MAKIKFEQLDSSLETQEQASDAITASSSQRDDETRQEVARKFVRYYFLLLTLIIIGIPAYNALMYALAGSNDLAISFKDAILTYSAVVGPTVGLVVAYYFKTKQD